MDDRQGRLPYEYIKKIFTDMDPIMISNQSQIPFMSDRSCFIITMMGRKYKLTYPDAQIIDISTLESINSYTIKILVLRYIVNSRAVPPFNKDITYKEIPGAMVYYKNFYDRTIMYLAQIFSNDLIEFKECAQSVDAKFMNIGDASCRFEFIDNIFITFVLWQADDELSAQANILFDKNIEYYFNAEDLAVLGDISIYLFRHKGIMSNLKK